MAVKVPVVSSSGAALVSAGALQSIDGLRSDTREEKEVEEDL